MFEIFLIKGVQHHFEKFLKALKGVEKHFEILEDVKVNELD